MPTTVNKSSKGQAAKQITCLVCNSVHLFKLTKNGFIMGNGQYIKVRDDKGLVNYFGSKIKKFQKLLSPFEMLRQEEQSAGQGIQMMDSSVNIPQELVIRSLPLNIELIQLIKKNELILRLKENQEPEPPLSSKTQLVQEVKDFSPANDSDQDTEQEVDSVSYDNEEEDEGEYDGNF